MYEVFVSASWAYELEADGLTFRWAYPGKLWVVDDPQSPVQNVGRVLGSATTTGLSLTV